MVIYCWFPLSPTWGQGSEVNNERSIIVHTKRDSFFLSAFTVLPHTVQITESSDGGPPPHNYRIEGSFFIWDYVDSSLPKDSVSYKVTFRVLSSNLSRWTSRFDSLLYLDGSLRVMEPLTVRPFDNRGESKIFDQGIQYDGSFARGLSLGNRQDLVLNSNFDLRLSGLLGDGIEVSAALSDNSIPLQPDGNTQQLQEFDKIFIQLTKDENTLIGGDFELSRPKSYFTNYFKKTQGVKVINATELKPGRTLTSAASLGGSRGKFARINVSTQEGNQGPYRLEGSQNERFIIILAGTEKIYMDGLLLVRGLEKDYVIDYNSGELTFTANRMITKDSRVIAEYEYSDQNYNRSVYTFETDYDSRKLHLHFNAYSEQDGKLSSGLNDLSAEDKRFLAGLGDSTTSVLSSTIRLREEGYDPNIVMYKLVDTLPFGEVLVRSTNPDSARYVAKFTLVGQGNGDYIRTSSEDNGEVYAWIRPDSLGQQQGSYAPVAPLVAPQQRQMFSFGGSHTLGSRGVIKSELAISRLDQNRFSNLDRADDYGYAVVNSLSKTFALQKRDSIDSGWQLKTEIQSEIVSKTFESLNPYRSAEFSRDWSLTNLPDDKEFLTNGLLQLVKPGSTELSYAYSDFTRKGVYEGQKNVFTGRYRRGGFSFFASSDLLNADDADHNTRFYRPRIDISQALNKDKSWTVGWIYEQEKNQKRFTLSDTLTPASFYFDLNRFYLRKDNSQDLTLEVQYQKRYDYFAEGKEFTLSTEADDVNIRTRWSRKAASILDATFTIRDLEIKNSATTALEGGLNYVGKINHQFNLWQGAFRTTTAYELGSGQEPRRTFQYLKVDPGQGVYTFIDLNDDGIQQINEFEVAAFPEQATFVRITVLTNDFIATNNVNFNQSYSLDPRRILKNKKSFLAKWSDQGSLRIIRKNLQDSGLSIWNPFTLDIADSSLVSVSSQIRNVLYFNRSNPKYDIQHEWTDFRNRVVLTTGYESKRVYKNTIRSRANFHKQFSGLLSFSIEQNDQDSETFDSKDYRIFSREAKPELTWQPSTSFRLIGKYRWINRKNLLTDGSDQAKIHDFNLEATISKVSTSSVRGNFSIVLIDYTGPRNGALEFAMLEGLKDGTNLIWGLSYDRRLASNIRINISYDGRKSKTAKIVHTARAQVSAFF